jgi:hypothetical protein
MPGHRGGRAGRVARWRARYWQRLQEVKTDTDRIAVALDHLRLALKYTSPQQRTTVIAAIVAEIAGTAEELLSHYETRGRKRS